MGIDHLSFIEALDIIAKARPKQVILTHFGITMLKENPLRLARKASQELGIPIKAARDGLRIKF